MVKILLTGATGFVGKMVLSRLGEAGVPVRRAQRGTAKAGHDVVTVGPSIGSNTEWRRALEGCTAVVHLAAQTPGGGATVAAFREINDLGTRNLVEQAKDMGIETFVLMSSIFAIAENSSPDIVSDASAPRALLPYGRSKLAAEEHVANFAAAGRTGVSLRPPLVYGSNANGNWKLLQRLAATGAPLPFGAIRNRRNMVSIDNLVDAVICTLNRAEPAKSGTYAVADSESVSLAETVRYLREGMGKAARLLPVPKGLLAASLKVLGRGQILDSLLGNFEIDASRFCQTFDWQPVETAVEGIRKSGAGFVKDNGMRRLLRVSN